MTRIAAMENDKSHTAKEISTLSKIPLPTVTRLLKTLSNEGLLNSQRGVKEDIHLHNHQQLSLLHQ